MVLFLQCFTKILSLSMNAMSVVRNILFGEIGGPRKT